MGPGERPRIYTIFATNDEWDESHGKCTYEYYARQLNGLGYSKSTCSYSGSSNFQKWLRKQ